MGNTNVQKKRHLDISDEHSSSANKRQSPYVSDAEEGPAPLDTDACSSHIQIADNPGINACQLDNLDREEDNCLSMEGLSLSMSNFPPLTPYTAHTATYHSTTNREAGSPVMSDPEVSVYGEERTDSECLVDTGSAAWSSTDFRFVSWAAEVQLSKGI